MTFMKKSFFCCMAGLESSIFNSSLNLASIRASSYIESHFALIFLLYLGLSPDEVFELIRAEKISVEQKLERDRQELSKLVRRRIILEQQESTKIQESVNLIEVWVASNCV